MELDPAFQRILIDKLKPAAARNGIELIGSIPSELEAFLSLIACQLTINLTGNKTKLEVT